LKYSKIPALSGIQLKEILEKDKWIAQRFGRHGVSLKKEFKNITRVTVIPYTKESLPKGTLMAILGYKQTNLRKKGLLNLLNKH